MRALALVLLIIPLAGCVSIINDAADSCEMPEVYNFAGSALTDPRQDWQTVMLSLKGNAPTLTPGDVERHSPTFSVLTVPANETQNPVLRVGTKGEYCESSTNLELAEGREGATARQGRGALVYTAGFWTNGTLFYTNIPEFNDNWQQKAGWYEWGGGDPLQVYIYDQSTSEQPPQWGGRADTPVGPVGLGAAGSPAAYFPTIKGFNDGLKGLSTTTTKVVWMAPGDAYTRDGNEAHPLYGDALIFLQNISHVADQPCPFDVPSFAPCFRS